MTTFEFPKVSRWIAKILPFDLDEQARRVVERRKEQTIDDHAGETSSDVECPLRGQPVTAPGESSIPTVQETNFAATVRHVHEYIRKRVETFSSAIIGRPSKVDLAKARHKALVEVIAHNQQQIADLSDMLTNQALQHEAVFTALTQEVRALFLLFLAHADTAEHVDILGNTGLDALYLRLSQMSEDDMQEVSSIMGDSTFPAFATLRTMFVDTEISKQEQERANHDDG